MCIRTHIHKNFQAYKRTIYHPHGAGNCHFLNYQKKHKTKNASTKKQKNAKRKEYKKNGKPERNAQSQIAIATTLKAQQQQHQNTTCSHVAPTTVCLAPTCCCNICKIRIATFEQLIFVYMSKVSTTGALL